jgi:hypothetical protein
MNATGLTRARIFHSHLDPKARRPCSAGYQTRCIADFEVGRVCDGLGMPQVWKLAIQQTWKCALRCPSCGLLCNIRVGALATGQNSPVGFWQ